MERAEADLEAGRAAQARGDWRSARQYFEAGLRREETAPALEGLSDALYWLEEFGSSFDHRRRAYTLDRAGGDPARRARAALWLARATFPSMRTGRGRS